jgi:hypothetical protein
MLRQRGLRVAGAALGAIADERLPEPESERTDKFAAEGVSDTSVEYIKAGSGSTLTVSHSGFGESQGTVRDGVESKGECPGRGEAENPIRDREFDRRDSKAMGI